MHYRKFGERLLLIKTEMKPRHVAAGLFLCHEEDDVCRVNLNRCFAAVLSASIPHHSLLQADQQRDKKRSKRKTRQSPSIPHIPLSADRKSRPPTPHLSIHHLYRFLSPRGSRGNQGDCINPTRTFPTFRIKEDRTVPAASRRRTP